MTVHFLFEQGEENQSKLLCIVICLFKSCRNVIVVTVLYIKG